MGGSNAWLYARLVGCLEVITKGSRETISWTEPDDVGSNPDTCQLVVLEFGRHRSISRSTEEYLGAEPFHRWDA